MPWPLVRQSVLPPAHEYVKLWPTPAVVQNEIITREARDGEERSSCIPHVELRNEAHHTRPQALRGAGGGSMLESAVKQPKAAVL